ncbi:MAG: hypothetical protein WCK33_02590 [Phycisphaerae bacterium]
MHRSIAAGGDAAGDRRSLERERLSISARAQMMTFARALWLRERSSPRGDASLWRLWESDWTVIRRTAVKHLPIWCCDATAIARPVESHRLAITFLLREAIPEALNTPSAASSAVRPTVAVRSIAGSSTPLLASPSLVIQRSLDDIPSIAVASEANARLAKTCMLESGLGTRVLELISDADRGLLQ